jgi:hypothetical protein
MRPMLGTRQRAGRNHCARGRGGGGVDGYAAAKGKVLPCPFFLGVGRFLELDMGMGREMVLAASCLWMIACW